MPQIKYWNGTAWVVPKAIRVWDGSQWVQRIGKYWNGSAWVAFITYFSNAWSSLPLMASNYNGYSGSGAWTSQFIHCVGGLDSTGSALSTHRAFNTSTETYSALQSHPTTFSIGRGCAIGEKVYVGTNNALSVYDVAGNSWTTLAIPSPAGNLNALTSLSPQKLIRMSTSAGSHAIYDIASNTWSSMADMSLPRASAFTGTVNGKFYLAGGDNNAAGTACYDPATNTWSYLLTISPQRWAGASGVLNGMLVCASGATGGNTAPNGVTTNQGYVVATNTWTTLTSIPSARHLPSFSTSPDGRAMAVWSGRSTGSTTSTTLYKFT